MTSGFWITLFFPIVTVIFIILELVQLQRRRNGNKSAYTMSQFVIKKMREGSRFWLWFCIIFIAFYICVMIWLWVHWSMTCFAFGKWC